MALNGIPFHGKLIPNRPPADFMDERVVRQWDVRRTLKMPVKRSPAQYVLMSNLGCKKTILEGRRVNAKPDKLRSSAKPSTFFVMSAP